MAEENQKRRVMLIDDDPDIKDILTNAYKATFEGADIDLKVVTSGKEAVKKLKDSFESEEGKFDLVLLDLVLPDISGVEVLKAIKTDEKIKATPVFVLSNQGRIDPEQTGGLAPDKFIVKSDINPTELIAIIKENLKI